MKSKLRVDFILIIRPEDWRPKQRKPRAITRFAILNCRA
jgi:hypothetical protein